MKSIIYTHLDLTQKNRRRWRVYRRVMVGRNEAWSENHLRLQILIPSKKEITFHDLEPDNIPLDLTFKENNV